MDSKSLDESIVSVELLFDIIKYIAKARELESI